MLSGRTQIRRTLPGHLSPHRHGEVQGRGLRKGCRVTKLIKSGVFVEDAFTNVADDASLPDGAVIVSLKRFQAERATLLARNTPLGITLQSSEDPTVLGADLSHFAVIALQVPKFRDGRAFSWARKLRTKLGY